MHAQLSVLEEEFMRALDQLHLLVELVPAADWTRRRDPQGWSVAECVAHLNLTSVAYLPLLQAAVEEARALGGSAPARYRRDPAGWLLWATMGPPVRIRTRTIPSFIPAAAADQGPLVAEFERLQNAQMAALHQSDGLPLGRVRVASPFNRKVKYNLFACFGIVARHQHRHLWQAAQLWPEHLR
ncbi:MAG: DinB family protein [Gemmatimonadota bacterium]|nr:DinB family protein [Gemmatimonadota bacterium]